MSRAKLIVVVAVVLAASAAAVTLLTQNAGAGPLWPKDFGGFWIGVPAKPGQIAVMTIDLHQAKSPAVLLDVRPRNAAEADGLTIRYAATTGTGLRIAAAAGWKPKAWQLHPVAGFVVPAHRRAGIMVGASATERGLHFLHGFVLDYRIGSTHYSVPLDQEFQICVARRCP